MTNSKLQTANILNERIKALKHLKIYLEDDDKTTWWKDILRLFLPRKIYWKFRKKNGYDLDIDYKSYDEMFAKDILECVDKLLDKYQSKLDRL